MHGFGRRQLVLEKYTICLAFLPNGPTQYIDDLATPGRGIAREGEKGKLRICGGGFESPHAAPLSMSSESSTAYGGGGGAGLLASPAGG